MLETEQHNSLQLLPTLTEKQMLRYTFFQSSAPQLSSNTIGNGILGWFNYKQTGYHLGTKQTKFVQLRSKVH